ncbi:D-alanyl-D-alanine carboxypeptidase [Rhodoblastus acidophilus]|uniref:D-alanyl-D-alanine carboxypeptidase family protein n=1 Tax=Candidatus Rhodoblastus alkanivorans TaxID=2954117 RepID=UPI001FAAA96C|nr:D-alanyl-D-alanine carboxypeptidase [Candidatus Rhodoblastus alkanivorans]
MLSRFLPILLRLWLALAFVVPLGAAQAQTITTTAPHALVMDFDTQTVLFEKGADDPVPPASLAKLMTAELVFRDLKKGRITLDTQFYISEHAWKTGRQGGTMFARVNTNIRVEDLLRGLIVQSGNDAAVALAEGIGGSEQNFAAMMNVRAAELGMAHTHFTDSWGGADPAQVTTARDMAILAEHILKTYPNYYHYFGEKEFTWSKIRQLNRNPILSMDVNGDGLKVGNEKDGDYNIVGSAVYRGRRLIVVLLGAKTARERAEEARRLFNWGFHGFDAKTLFNANETVGTAKVYGGAKDEVPLVSDAPIKVLVQRGSPERLTGKIVYTGPLIAPVSAGETVARLKVYQGATLVLDLPLKTAEADEQGPLPERARDAALELGVQLFHKGLAMAMHSLEKKASGQAAAPKTSATAPAESSVTP